MSSVKYNKEEGKIASQLCGVFRILNIHITLKKQLSNKKAKASCRMVVAMTVAITKSRKNL